MKRVGLFLAIEPTWGGAFQYDQSILDAMAQLPRDEIEVVIGYSDASWLQYLDRYQFKTVHIPFGYCGRLFAQLLHYSCISIKIWRAVTPWFHPTVRAILREKCDLWIFPTQDPWCYLAPVPALATIHDLMHRYELRFPEIGIKWQFLTWREWHYKSTCNWAGSILVDSKLGKQHVIDSYQIDQSRLYILPFVAPSYIRENIGELSSASEKQLPNKYLFYPAQFWEHKNHKRLVKALSILKSRFSDIKLVFAGAKKNEYTSIRNLVEQLGLLEDVIFLGYVPDNEMAILYQRARAMIMPSFAGPTNIPPLEAMETGCPFAVSNIYAMPEQANGAALLFDPESVEDIASVMAKLWEDDELCRKLVERGRVVSSEWTREHFEARFYTILSEVFDIYEKQAI